MFVNAAEANRKMGEGKELSLRGKQLDSYTLSLNFHSVTFLSEDKFIVYLTLLLFPHSSIIYYALNDFLAKVFYLFDHILLLLNHARFIFGCYAVI